MSASGSRLEADQAEGGTDAHPQDGEEDERDAPPVDSTAHTLAYLRILRRTQHRTDAKNTLYAAYCAVILCAVWVVPYLAAAASAAQQGGPSGELALRMLAATPASLAALLAVVMLSAARTACWRGPVRLDEAAVSWLLPHVVRRAPLLLPSLRRSALFAASTGAAVGGMAGFALQALTAGAWWTTTLAGLWAGAATGASCTALGVLVQRRQERATRRGTRWWLAARGGALFLVLLAVAAAIWESTTLSWLLLLSGPWGWSLLPLATASGLASGWVALAGCVLTSATLGFAVPGVLRAARTVPTRVLRLQARLSIKATAALYTLDLRGARAIARSVYERRAWRGWRLPPPRRRWLLVPWRDLTALLRSPSQLTSALLRAGASAVLLRLSAESTDELSTLAGLVALVVGYSAAVRAAVAARLDGEDARRSSQLPWRHGTLALWHAVVPCLLVGVGALSGVTVSGAVWGAEPSGALLLAGVPAFVAAALVTTYQGDLPPHTLIGTDTAMGNTGALNALVWRGRGPLVVLGSAAPVYLMPLPALVALGWLAVVTGGALWWVRRVAKQR